MPRPKKIPPPPLHELESEVMDAVWKRGDSTVRDILEALNRRRRQQRAYTTVMTIMARLDRKGLLERTRVGRTDVYRPVMDRDSYLAARAEAEVSAVVAEFGDLALARFSTELDKLGPERARKLRKLAGRD